MSHPRSLVELEQQDAFIQRHIGPDAEQQQSMLDSLGLAALEQLIDQAVPQGIRLTTTLDLAAPRSERDVLSYLKSVAGRNQLFTSCIGMGYYDTIVPPVILRNVLENPGWYTAYTPYQPEISQGRLEALLNFQQMTLDLTRMQLANASLLDEATAAAEAMTLARRVAKSRSNRFFIDEDCHPQTISVVRTRAEAFGFELVVADVAELDQHQVFGELFQYTTTWGDVRDLQPLIAQVQAQQGLACVAADPLSLVLLTPPGELGADVVFGSSQRFGVPMGYGGPHAAFFATRDEYKRAMPGRIIGVSVDSRGKRALRMALQTREQHIRREKANSNICTAQVLLANIASFYAVYHGPDGLRRIAERVHRLTAILALGLERCGIVRSNQHFFDTLTLKVPGQAKTIVAHARNLSINLRLIDADNLGVSLDETSNAQTVAALLQCFAGEAHGQDIEALDLAVRGAEIGIVPQLRRQTPLLQHPVFNRHHSESAMLRYIKSLENKDLALNHAMIPLGSCTMKLNATTEMIPITWPEFAGMHPFAPQEQAAGYRQMIDELEAMLRAITGFDAISMQPNSGAQGEYAGLLAIRKYHEANGDAHRNVCLIPTSAHGTNPASAQMAGMRVVLIACDEQGNVNIEDLRSKAEAHATELSCLMITYPSTHGVYEEGIREICDIVHQQGGQVYMDGANLNALVGLARPADFGADVSHMNLHKTFCIPHGGGGPGMGPIGVKAHLTPHVANHIVVPLDGPHPENDAVSAAPWGSASILPISWTYIALMGASGLRRATEVAILNANYIARRLEQAYPVLYSGRNGWVAHECIIDIRPIKAASGISEEDIAKRLMDFGFHAPTMSFPVAGTLMIEPTESESREELDRFIDAMLAIRKEIEQVEQGHWPAEDNPLHQAPHSMADITGDWRRSYSREQAVFPLEWVAANKFWPAVNRIDNVYGDRNLFCACPPLEDWAE
ncbi:MAG: aminomethyl-transferring glycine dehydrogenase [Pseudomonas sp.]